MKTTILLGLLGLAMVAAECPNACSGNGVCGSKDSCTCYKNYQGNDCSERTCAFGYAHVDTPKGDLDGDGDVDTTTTVASAGSIVYGATGTQEQFPDGSDYEAHFYMECSNKGLCNRKTGECDCLDGYEGTACQRASCPNACSGHGTCESIKELAELGPSTWVNSDASAVRGATTYALWDQDIGMGCLCDPEYQGADCSERQCKYGVDPLYEAEGTEVNEEVYLTISAGADDLGGSYKLRFFDVFGEDWKTDYISVGASATAFCTNLVAGLVAIPNGVVSTATCDAGAIAGGYGYQAIIEFTANPGDLRTMEVWNTGSLTGTSASLAIYGSPRNGEFVDKYSTQATATVSALANADTALTLSSDESEISAGTLIKIGKHQLAASAVTTTAVTLAYTYQGAARSSGDYIYISNAVTATVQDSGAADVTAAASVGDTTFVFSAAPDNVSRGSLIYVEDRYYTVRSVSTTSVVVDEAFSGIRSTQTDADLTAADFFSAATASAAYVITTAATSTYTYVSECSGRGTCDRSTGVCKCFKGYANDNCDTQNALAA